jgi:hypothetical protein
MRRAPGAIDPRAAHHALDIVQPVVPGELLEEHPLTAPRERDGSTAEVDGLDAAGLSTGLASIERNQPAHEVRIPAGCGPHCAVPVRPPDARSSQVQIEAQPQPDLRP